MRTLTNNEIIQVSGAGEKAPGVSTFSSEVSKMMTDATIYCSRGGSGFRYTDKKTTRYDVNGGLNANFIPFRTSGSVSGGGSRTEETKQTITVNCNKSSDKGKK